MFDPSRRLTAKAALEDPYFMVGFLTVSCCQFAVIDCVVFSFTRGIVCKKTQ